MAGLNFDIFAQDKTGRAFDAVKGKVTGLKSAFGGLKGALGGLPGLIAGAFSLAALKNIAEMADRINDLSTRLKINAEVLSSYQLVASEVGVTTEAIARSLQQLAKNSVKAADGQGAAREALNALGIDASKFKELAIDEQFAVVAEAMQGIENPAQRVNLAMALMGKSGAEMLQVMELGGDGLRAMQEEANNLGVTLTQTQAQDIGGMMDALGRLGLAAKGVGQDFIAVLAPAITAVANTLTYILLGAVDTVVLAWRSLWDFVKLTIGELMNATALATDALSALPGKVGEDFAKHSQSIRETADSLTNATVKTDDLFLAMRRQNGEMEKSNALFKKVKGSMPSSKTNADIAANNQLLNDAKRVYEETRTPLERYNQEMEKLKKLYDGKLIDSDTLGRAKGQAYDDLQKSMNTTAGTGMEAFSDLSNTLQSDAQRIEDSWIDSMLGIGGGFDNLRQTAMDSLKQIGSSMLKNGLNRLMGGFGMGGGGGVPWTNPDTGQVMGGGGGGLISGMSGLFSSAASSMGNFFGGFFAEGGNFMGGKPIVVGERGAEVIMPRSGGTVIPNHAMGRPVSVNVNISTPDVNGFRRSQGQVTAALAESVRRGTRNL